MQSTIKVKIVVKLHDYVLTYECDRIERWKFFMHTSLFTKERKSPLPSDEVKSSPKVSISTSRFSLVLYFLFL